jgi:hypothetical protein
VLLAVFGGVTGLVFAAGGPREALFAASAPVETSAIKASAANTVFVIL